MAEIKSEEGENSDEHKIELSDKEEEEAKEIVEDFMIMQNKEVLKRNLTSIVRENLILKKKSSLLEERLKQVKPKTDPSLSFHIDTDGTEDVTEADTSQITYVSTNVNSSLVLGAKSPSPTPEPSSTSKSTCWNCEGSHTMAECKEPKDFRRIGRNRKEFMSQNAMQNTSRYHVDTEQKFGHIVPGVPSKRLREALGVKPDHLPPYIYKLRVLGYPPGWLKHAEIRRSGMAMYHQKGEKLEMGGEEEGEVVVEDKIKYDTDRLVSWPGFNADLPSGYVDDTNRYRVPPLHRCHSLKDMKRDMKDKKQKGYRKGKMQDVSTDNAMDLDDEDSKEDDPVPPGEEDEEEGKTDESPSGTGSSTPIKQAIGSGKIAETLTGTPIVDGHSPFSQLPKYSNFNVDMTEHIVFDNLPNYTGTWDKMTGLIQRIRNRKEGGEEDEGEEEDL